jgi:hypothetical protein
VERLSEEAQGAGRVIKSRVQEDIRNLCDLHAPLTDHEKVVVAKVAGPRIEAKPVTRQPYDSLTVKLKRQERL